MAEIYDAIIIGSGPGGATVAKELSEKGQNVVILERGGNPKLKGKFFQYILYQMIPFKSLLLTNGFLGMVRGLITGGSSVFYYATSFKVPVDMLKTYGIDVSKEVKEAINELPIAPLKDEMMTPMANRIMESAKRLGFKWEKLDKLMYQDRWKPGMEFGYYGDPNDVKWTARMYVDEAVANGADLFIGAKVKKILSEDGRAIGVDYRMNGKNRSIFAKKIILSAGGIGSPVVLKQSGLDGVGENFFYDPLISVCGVVDDVRASAEIPMSAGVRIEEDGYMMTDMSLPSMLDAIFSAQVFRFHRIFSRKKTLRIMIKAKDSLGGNINKCGQVRKALSKEDKEKLMKGYDNAKKILQEAGAKGIFKTWYLAAHPGGTVKIGEFIDSDLMSKDIENLYVCDCSVIPEPWGLPPTLTLISLGKRLAKHLTKSKDKAKPKTKKNKAKSKIVKKVTKSKSKTKTGKKTAKIKSKKKVTRK